MGEHVAPDLAKRRLEEHEWPVVHRAAHCLAKTLDGRVQDLESLIKFDEAGSEFKWLLAPHGLKASEGFLDSRVIRKHAVEGGELQHHSRLLVGGSQPQVALAASDLLQGGDHGAQPGGVDKADALHVDDHPRRAVLDQLADRVFERRRACNVKAAGGGDHGDAALRLAGLDVESHSRKSIWQKARTLASLRCPALGLLASARPRR